MTQIDSSARRTLRLAGAGLATLFLCGRAFAFELVSNLPSPQPLGTTITWSVMGDPPQPGDNVDFRLVVRPAIAGESARIVYDYTKQRDFEWTPMQEAAYSVTVFVRNQTSGQTTQLRQVFVAQPRATVQPVVSTTRNPLVALYSAPPCALGLTMEVTFWKVGDTNLQTTDRKACDGDRTMNFLVAGMRAQTTYRLRHVQRDANGNPAGGGAPIPFTTGTPEPGLPTVKVTVPPGPGISAEDDILLTAANSGTGTPIATDLEGNLVWYYTAPDQRKTVFLRSRAGGNLFLLSDPVVPADRDVWREVDLASNIVRQTNSRRISEALRALGQPPISLFHHESRVLPNGHVLIFGSTERIFVDVQGPGPVDVLGDMVIELDENMQPVWAAKMFDILDVSRPAVLGEVCFDGDFACPPLWFDDQANDWTHTNSIDYSESDGNLIVSVRHQDWVVKIDYRDGAGTGALLWRLGREGDFALTGAANDGWFSHQHDVNYIGDDLLIMYDNGNGHPECLADPAQCVSSGKVYRLDENARTATPVLNANLGNYSSAIGAAQRLSNGNYAFTSGLYNGTGKGRSHEVDPQGNIIFELEVSQRAYRSFRVRDLYTPPAY